MWSWLRSKRVTWVLAALVWVAGTLIIWWALPVVPRNWQPPADQKPLGFLSDGRTLVTQPRQNTSLGCVGPVRLWDVDKGRLLASHFSPEDAFERLGFDHLNDRLEVQQRRVEGADSSDTFDLRLLDAHSAREIAHFSHRLQGRKPYSLSWWEISPDGETIAFGTVENGQFQIEWYDVASGRLLLRLPWAPDRIVFSPDSRRFAADKGGAVTIWEVPTGGEITSFTVPQRRFDCAVGYYALKEFSPDGQWVLDGDGGVREAATGNLRFQVPGEMASCTFSADGQWLIVNPAAGKERVVNWYDLAPGEVRPGQRLSLGSQINGSSWLQKGTPDGRLLLALGHHWGVPSFVRGQLSRLPGLASLTGDSGEKYTYIVIDEKRRQVFAQGDGLFIEFNAQGTLFLTQDHHEKYLLWDFPPRKSLPGFLALAAALGMSIVVLVRWRLRRQQPQAQKETAPDPTAV